MIITSVSLFHTQRRKLWQPLPAWRLPWAGISYECMEATLFFCNPAGDPGHFSAVPHRHMRWRQLNIRTEGTHTWFWWIEMGLCSTQEDLRTYFVQVSVLALNGPGDFTKTRLCRHCLRADMTRLLIGHEFGGCRSSFQCSSLAFESIERFSR